MADEAIQDGPVDNNAGSANPPGAGEQSPAFMERPQWVPEKFFKDGVIDYKGMATSYQELEKKQSAPKPEAPPQPAPTQEQPQNQQQQAPVEIPGIAKDRMTAFTGEIQKDGKLSEGSYGELAKAGYPKAVVDAYIKGLMADAQAAQAVESARVADKEINSIVTEVGGQETLKEMLAFATANFSEADLKTYNEAVSSNDPAKVRMAVMGLKHAYSQSEGQQPNYLELGAGNRPLTPGGVEAYTSADEVAADMAKREYRESESFRQKVAKRLAVSNVFGQSRDVSKESLARFQS